MSETTNAQRVETFEEWLSDQYRKHHGKPDYTDAVLIPLAHEFLRHTAWSSHLDAETLVKLTRLDWAVKALETRREKAKLKKLEKEAIKEQLQLF